jgi:tripeptide aminopeptidase
MLNTFIRHCSSTVKFIYMLKKVSATFLTFFIFITYNTEVLSQEADSEISQQITVLAESKLIKRAFQFIKDYDNQTVSNQIHLNEIPAPPFQESRRAERYADMMREFGLNDVFIDSEGNAIGRRQGSIGNRIIVISAHLDTVFPEETDITVSVVNDTLYAPGIVDDARGLTTVLTILKTLEELDIQTEQDIWFVGTVGEEGIGDLRGVKHLFREDGEQIDVFISIDGSDDTRIVNRALGSHRYRITFNGPGGHSWSAFGNANPAHALARTISHFEKEASAFVSEGPGTSFNIGRIAGGTSVNSIPFSVWMEVDMRSVDQERLLKIDEILQASINKGVEEANEMRTRGPELTVNTEMIGRRPSGEINPENPFIQRAIAITHYFGNEPDLVRSSTDSNVPISMGIPAITLGGGGSSGGAHSPDEWWFNDKGYEGIQRAFLLLLAEAGLTE